MMTPAAAHRLNNECFCVSVDRGALLRELDDGVSMSGFGASLSSTHPHLFSDSSVFVSGHDIEEMMETVRAIEAAARKDAYRAAALSWAPDIAHLDFSPRGVFMGYDFHLSEDGPRLIEVNTNAGGALLNSALRQAHNACCAAVDAVFPRPADDIGARIVGMFRKEWEAQRGSADLRRIAIVDDAPKEQYLYPEFLLVQTLLRQHGIEAIVAAPEDVEIDGDSLVAGHLPVDLVYNRLTDFYLEAAPHSVLRAAYAQGLAVLTPNPHHHAIYANKRNLTLLSDPNFVAGLGLSQVQCEALTRVPQTLLVSRENADTLWAGRKNYFFKPISGFGSKAVYRGDKLTRSAWDYVVQSRYVAQRAVNPSRRRLGRAPDAAHKMDVRLFTYASELLLPAARLYEGQTTNFRTPGGGFAAVIVA